MATQKDRREAHDIVEKMHDENGELKPNYAIYVDQKSAGRLYEKLIRANVQRSTGETLCQKQ